MWRPEGKLVLGGKGDELIPVNSDLLLQGFSVGVKSESLTLTFLDSFIVTNLIFFKKPAIAIICKSPGSNSAYAAN